MPTEPTGSSRVPFATRFSLATNSDAELVPALKGYPVDEVYGKLPGDGISGDRPRYLATRHSIQRRWRPRRAITASDLARPLAQ
jgi:hypothetical protein